MNLTKEEIEFLIKLICKDLKEHSQPSVFRNSPEVDEYHIQMDRELLSKLDEVR